MMGMRNLVWPVFLALVLFATIEAKRRYRWGFMDGRPLKDHYAIQAVGADSAADCYAHPENYGVNTFYFPQPLDHFDNSSNKATWQQQVQWKNTSFTPKDDGDVIFLMIGGEGPIPTTWMCFMNYTWTQLAEQHGAFMFQLEHRYFGNSTPTSNMSVPNLKWLTTEQAMADINEFIPAMNKQFNFTNPKWVAFGGSYPGTISALLRKFYPNITLGNIASSAPLWAKVDFWEYAEKMQQAILWESQKNDSNAACYNETRNAFSDAKNKLYTKDGKTEYNNVFNIQPPFGSTNTTDLDASNFLSLIFSSFQGIIQYTFDDRSKSTENKTSGLNVANLCKIMVDTSTSYSKRLKQVYDWEQGWDTPGYNSAIPFNNDYWADLAPFMNVSFDGDQASMRGWMWLSCNEFGWLQTTDNGYGIFGNIISLNFFLQQCTDMFDKTIDNAYIQKQVSASLQRFGLPQDFRATNVVLPNGSLDPWSTLGCNVTVNSTNQFARTTVGGAHCVDMYPYDPAKYPDNTVEPADVNATIQLVKDQVANYLTLPATQTPATSSNTQKSATSPNTQNPATSPNTQNPATSSNTQQPVTEGASMTSVSMVTIFVGILIHFVKSFL